MAIRTAILAKRNIGRGDKVLIKHGGTPSFFADLLAVWNVGACAACLNPAITEPELLNIIDFLKPALVLYGTGQVQCSDLPIPALILDREKSSSSLCSFDVSGHQDDDALILFTSGTTGTPKGVVHTARSLSARLALNQAYIPHKIRQKTLCPLPTHFGHGLIGNSLTALLGGNDLFLTRGGDLRLSAVIGKLIDDNNITFMSSVPAHWKVILKASPPPSRSSLRKVHIGSAPLSVDLWNSVIQWSGTNDVANMYGITETCNWIGGASAASMPPEEGLVGAVWGGSAAILTNTGDICKIGKGEIIVSTPSLMSGYFNLNDLTNQVLENGWFHTGDIGVIDRNGMIKLTGRQKFEINRGGLKVHPEDIDVLLERHPSVLEATAFGVADSIVGQTVAVAVCADTGWKIDIEELQRWCVENLTREKIPEKWFVLSEIPKTDRGKVNRDHVANVCLSKS